MKRLSVFNKFVFAINTVFAILLLAACAVPHISAQKFSFLAFLSLTVPFLVLINLLFVLYWFFCSKKRSLLSLSVLIGGYFSLGTFIKFPFFGDEVQKDELKVMSYNVRVFNRNKNMDRPNVFEDIQAFVGEQDPDIICFQEIDYTQREKFVDYPYQYVKYINYSNRAIMGILSKYPIIDKGSFSFPNTINDAAFADIVYKKDTIRVYSLHLQSFGLDMEKKSFIGEPSKRLFKRLNGAFKKQQEQAEIFRRHKDKSPYPTLVCGDFNNTQFSNVYKVVKGDMLDTFSEKGMGYGMTYNFLHFPLRIDFIFSDENFEIMAHKNFKVRLSDHFPVMASFRLKDH